MCLPFLDKDPNGKPVDPTWMDLRRKRSFYPWQFRGLLKDAMEAFDVTHYGSCG